MTFHFGAQKKKETFQFSPPHVGFVGFFLSYLEKADLLMYRQTRARSVFCCISREHVTKRKLNKTRVFCFNLAELSNLEIQGRSTCLYGQAVK